MRPQAYTRRVRRLVFVVISLMALNFALVPFNTVHAHLAEDHDYDHAAVLHGGHVHDALTEEQLSEATGFEQIVSLQVAAADHGSVSLTSQWMPVIWILVAMTLGLAAIREVFRPPGIVPRPNYRRSWQRPPLRGPPLASI
jgi:hypothetical protein